MVIFFSSRNITSSRYPTLHEWDFENLLGQEVDLELKTTEGLPKVGFLSLLEIIFFYAGAEWIKNSFENIPNYFFPLLLEIIFFMQKWVSCFQ